MEKRKKEDAELLIKEKEEEKKIQIKHPTIKELKDLEKEFLNYIHYQNKKSK